MILNASVFLTGIFTLSAHIHLALAQAQPETQTSTSASHKSCAFSCPPTNLISWPIAKRPYTAGVDSYYTIFECVYATPHPTPHDLVSEHKCTYNKYTGVQALAAAGDNCPLQAIPCPDSSSSSAESSKNSSLDLKAGQNTPLFSHIDGEEVVPWVEGGRFLLFLKENPPA